MVLFTLSQDPACWWVVALMPSLMILFGLCRGDAMSKAGGKRRVYQKKIAGNTAFLNGLC